MREITLVKFWGDTDISAKYPQLIESVKEGTKQYGGQFVDGYLTKGRFDCVVSTEMPSPEATLSVWLQAHREIGGGFTTESLTGIPQEKLNQVLGQPRTAQSTR